MATLYTHLDSNIRKTWFLMTGFFIVVIAIGWGVSYVYGDPSFVVFATVFALVMNVTSYWFSDSIVVRMSRAQPADPEHYREVHRLLENLAITAGLPKPRLYVIDDLAPNAFATGRNPEHAVVAVTTGLLSILDKTELEGVLAHELSHVGNRDILVSTVAVVLVGFIAILSDFFLRFGGWGGGRERKLSGPLVVLVVIAAILAPIAARLIHFAISRKREFLADASGALLTRYPEGLARALEKISAHSRPMGHASHASAHLFIANPFGSNGGGLGSSITRMFSTHPPVEERVAALRGTQM